MPSFRLWRRPALSSEVIALGVQVARHPALIDHQPQALRKDVGEVAKALTVAPMMTAGKGPGQRAHSVGVAEVAARAARTLQHYRAVVPADIESALRAQGMDSVAPFAPGRPLQPYMPVGSRPRGYDFKVARNVTTKTRGDRIPFETLKQIIDGYDIARICIRYIQSDLRSMPLKWGPMDGYEGDVKKDVPEAIKFWKRPDGYHFFSTWLTMYMRDTLRYDAGTLWKERNRAGRLLRLKVIDGTTIAPLRDYFGDWPEAPAPAFQQFIQGVPWDWMSTDDIVYQPMWPTSDDPHGEPPIETVLLNANTDVRLQLFFLNFFTEGTIPELLIPAPKDMSDPDGLAELQETWDDWMYGDQTKRRGARFAPDWDHPPLQLKQLDQIDPKIAEYVMRRTVAAHGLVAQNLSILDDVNRATADSQMDQQFRVGTLPHTEHYEAIINAITQEDLQLPVACHFDTGREAEDRLMEAQAHEIYVSIGAESMDEVRDKVLGLPVDNANPVPRGYISPRLGLIPTPYFQHVSPNTNPETYTSPKGTEPPPMEDEPFVALENISATVMPGGPQQAMPGAPQQPNGATPRTPQRATARKADDLAKWRKQSKMRVAKGQAPREFADSAIDQRTYDCIWPLLKHAVTTEAVDAAFSLGASRAKLANIGLQHDLSDPELRDVLEKATPPKAAAPVAGLVPGATSKRS